MPTKRSLEKPSSPDPKKAKLSSEKKQKTKDAKPKDAKPLQPRTSLLTEEVDFPRGGGTTLTPLEVKTIRAEAVKEANEELLRDAAVSSSQTKTKKRKSEGKLKQKSKEGKSASIRPEHLNYKRITPGMKLYGQIFSVQPLALIVSLPNQLWAHVPITQISSQLTKRLESMDEDEDMQNASNEEEDEDSPKASSRVPDIYEIFRPGQYVRGIVTAVHPAGSSESSIMGRAKDEVQKASRRVEMSLAPEKVNEGLAKADLKAGLTLTAAVASLEDHGYILELGVPNVTGFLSYREAEKGPFPENSKLHVGQIVDVAASAMSGNGRTCTVSVDKKILVSTSVSEITNVSSILPGMLVQSLITAVLPSGLNLQVLGSFEGTVDEYHVRTGDIAGTYKMGQKLKARVLYDIPGTAPPRFALSLLQHVVKMDVKRPEGSKHDVPSLQEAYPVGTILENVEVLRVEAERGLMVGVQDGVKGFIHISQTSDDHVPTLSPTTGPWKLGTIHRARVTGHLPLDGLLQLSLRPSVLEQKFLQVADVEVGSIVKGKVKKLTESAMFVEMSGSVDGVVWPNHYADIALKHPGKRFKHGQAIRCRVLVVDAERQRVVLTAKKTLIDSAMPIVARMEDARVGVVTHAVVFRVSEKNLNVEFYNGLKAIVPAREISETATGKLAETFPIGKPVTVRIISADPSTQRIVASIRQGAPNYKSALVDISGVEIGNIVQGTVAEIHKENIMLTLQPTQVRALLSLGNLANRRGLTVAQLRVSLKAGDEVDDLVVVSRNPEKGFVVVASRPKGKEALVTKGAISLDTLQIGQLVGGRVLRHGMRGAIIKLTNQIHGSLHPTDACDDYDTGMPYPAPDSVLKAAVLAIDREKKHLILSTRQSRLDPESQPAVVDPEIQNHEQLKVGETVRGFIKSVTDHGLFVTIGRNIDARVQIKELFDEFVKDWKPRFEANQLAKGRILSVDVEKKKVEMSFRSGSTSKSSAPLISFDHLSQGQKIDGRVKKVEDYGLFVEIEGAKITGLCHKSELSDNKDADVTLALRSFREGDRVKAVILSVDSEKRRISLGLKPSYFTEEEHAVPEDDEMGDGSSQVDEPLGVVEEGSVPSDSEDEEQGMGENDMDASEGAEESDVEVMDVDTDDRPRTFGNALVNEDSNLEHGADKSLPPLKLHGFTWEGGDAASDQVGGSTHSSDESEGEEQSNKKRRRRRKEIEQDLTADLQTKMPESNADFERLLLGSPNSSYIWIQYMSFQLRLAEIDKSRDIARRALRTINFREEAEKLNVWVALLNLENAYGTDETLESMFKEAARSCDSKTVHLRLAAIFDETGKQERAEEQYKRTCKKFGQSSKVWTLFCEHYLKRGQLEDARNLLSRSLQSLEKRKHLKTISKFAQLEYKLGNPERGRTIFEGIIDSHPKRHDLWLVYIDMETSQSDIQNIRNLFGRLFGQKMTSHKAKTLFKKWLELERRIGDEEGQALVKQKAVEWTQRAAGNE